MKICYLQPNNKIYSYRKKCTHYCIVWFSFIITKENNVLLSKVHTYHKTDTVGENIIATTKIRNNYGDMHRIINFSNIAIAILDFSLLLLVKLSLLILFASFWYQFFAFLKLFLSKVIALSCS